MSSKIKLIIKNLEQVVQVCNQREQFKSGPIQDNVSLIQRSATGVGAFVAINTNGLICGVGHDEDQSFKDLMSSIGPDTKIVDGVGRCVIPGFVDAHTHSVWSGDRLFEFDLKMNKSKVNNINAKNDLKVKGQPQNAYLDIHKSGGGIYFTVDQTTKSGEDELIALLMGRINNFVSCGTTTLEIKTGYGLDFETEMTQLKVIFKCKEMCKDRVDIATTLLPAHAVPRGMDANQGARLVIDILEKISEEVQKLDMKIDFVDAFCEKGVYEVNHCREIFTRARQLFPDVEIGFHGEELSNLDSPLLASEMHIKHISHLEHVSEDAMKVMAMNGVSAVLLPTTAYLLRLKPPNVRDMIDTYQIICCLASDFNPNAYCYSMASVMFHGVVYYHMTLNEALIGTTINAAFALGKHSEVGSIEIGKRGDLVLIKSSVWKRLIYQMGESKDLIGAVIKDGNVICGQI